MLKALELAGFKSFADKTRFEFPPGVTTLVGPNGSGKSNVVDAIKWAMGSQSAKSLRGQEMTDVIFSGASGRKPLNAAEVTLEFDNSQGLFGLPERKVRLTRRVYRSGEGEYLINGAPSRLRDIRSLLAGTGAGSEAYSIIEQGRVDALLRASPKQRRELFEEAAGVSRFRMKKQEASRRLARVEQNLLRLSDIVDEVEGRLRRVRSQAGRAQRYRDQAGRLRELRTRLGLVDWQASVRQEGSLQTEIDQRNAEHAAARKHLAELESELTDDESRLEAATQCVSEIDRRLAEVRERMGAAAATRMNEAKRVAELQEERRTLRNRWIASRVLKGKTPDDANDITHDRLNSALEQRDQTQALSQEAERRLAEGEALQTERRSRRDQLQQQLPTIRQAVERNHRDAQESLFRVKELERRAAELNTQGQAAERAKNQAIDAVNERQAQARALGEKLVQSETTLTNAQERTESTRCQLTDLQNRLIQEEAKKLGIEHRLDALKTLRTSLDSIGHDARRILSTAQDSDAVDQAGLGAIVADLIHVDLDTAPLIDVALGERARRVVVESGAHLMRAIASLQEEPASRISFERLDHAPAASVIDRIDLANEPGVMGRADHFVECEILHAPLMQRLLGRVWLVDTLETATRLSESVGRGLSYVTFAGELLTSDGGLVLGPKDEESSVTANERKHQELASSLEEISRRADALRQDVQRQESVVGESLQSERAALLERTTAADLATDAKHALQRERQELDRLSLEANRLSSQEKQVLDRLESTQRELSEFHDRREAVKRELDALEGDIASLDSEAAALAPRVRKSRALLEEHRIAAAKAEQRCEAIQEHLEQRARTASQQRLAEEQSHSNLVACQARLVHHELSQLAAGAAWNEWAIERDTLLGERRAVQAKAIASQRRRGLLGQKAKDCRYRCDQTMAGRQSLELQMEKLHQQRVLLAERMREDYDIDLEHDAESTPLIAPVEVEERKVIEGEITALRTQINTVGAVNLESLEELEDLESRFEQLSSQYQDLSEAKGSLETLMQRMNAESRELFLATVESVRGHFRELFRQLFGGGEADVQLLEEPGGDPMECGVEIAASPPGKELRSISLLSGGEKTLTCVALLLAVFRSKPSPFCVLDEVDAALDEANIGRFTGVLSDFLNATQFLVITHSKKTMTGADTMYGVTMQQSGVSKLVTVRFEDVTEDGQVKPTAMMGGEASLRNAA